MLLRLMVGECRHEGRVSGTSLSLDVVAAVQGRGAGTSTINGGRPLTYLLMISREPRPCTAASEPLSAQAMLQTATDADRRLRCCSSFSMAAACRATRGGIERSKDGQQ